jgi:hypothetical protein
MVVWLSYYCRPAVRLKQKTHRRIGSGLIDPCEQIRTRPPRGKAAHSAAGLSFDSPGEDNVAIGDGQINFKAAANDSPSPRRRGPG